MEAVSAFLALGPAVLIPAIVTVLGLSLGLGPGRAVRSGLATAVGFVGMFLVLGLLAQTLSPLVAAMVKRFHLGLEVADVGWPVSAALSYCWRLTPLFLLIIAGFNLALFLCRLTQTLDIDIWNYWQFLFTGAIVYHACGKSLVAAVVAVLACEGLTLVLADRTQPLVERYFGLKGVSIPHVGTVVWALPAWALNRLIDCIPGLRRLNADSDSVRRRLGVLGEPMAVGGTLGAGLAALAGYPATGVVSVGVTVGAVMVLLPRMVEHLAEGLRPVCERAAEVVGRRFPGRRVNIGLDVAVLISHPAVITTALLMVPLSLAVAVVLPGNRILPFTDLAILPSMVTFLVGASRGNLVRATLVGLMMLPLFLWVASDLAPAHALMLEDAPTRMAGVALPEPGSPVGSFYTGTMVVPWVLRGLLRLIW
ncbi:MAG: hypothetical protein K6T75_09940 [Acetobacteraceae bacterium]|nr:hypothetical protein [Acetobacteraceae bacterium]